jgi:hypothetical protein
MSIAPPPFFRQTQKTKPSSFNAPNTKERKALEEDDEEGINE